MATAVNSDLSNQEVDQVLDRWVKRGVPHESAVELTPAALYEPTRKAAEAWLEDHAVGTGDLSDEAQEYRRQIHNKAVAEARRLGAPTPPGFRQRYRPTSQEIQTTLNTRSPMFKRGYPEAERNRQALARESFR